MRGLIAASAREVVFSATGGLLAHRRRRADVCRADVHRRLSRVGAMREIRVGSGVEESVWLAGWLEEEPSIVGVKPKRIVAATGHGAAHYGRKRVKSRQADGRDQITSLGFLVIDSTRPFVAVRLIVDPGIEVHCTTLYDEPEQHELQDHVVGMKGGGSCVWNPVLLTEISAVVSTIFFTWLERVAARSRCKT